jgi:predicted lysophospholipase L1 biosynthesis ABC-type transport system permease subunit
VRAHLAGRNAVGRTVLIGGHPKEIVGVVGDARTIYLDRVEPLLYFPCDRGALVSMVMHNEPGLPRAMTGIATRLDPAARVTVKPLGENVDQSLLPSRVGAGIAGALGLLALTLATIGLAGAFAYAVQQRTREIGLRRALGAGTMDVLRLVVGSGSRPMLVGLVTGLVAAVAVSQLLRSQLYGLSPLSPLVYAGVAALLAASAVVATYLPARRALRIDPNVALRYE